MSIKLSILIATYNVENYIEKAIDSVLMQEYDNFEIIIVDDASTDYTYKILKEYATKYKNIFVYKNKSNKGIGWNRNFLISKAKGEYFLFLDSDDFFTKNLFKKCVPIIEEKKKDMYVFKTKIVMEKLHNVKFTFFPTSTNVQCFSGLDYVRKNIPLPWGSFIKTEFFRNLKLSFYNRYAKNYEDIGMMLIVYLSAKTFHQINFYGYNYLRRPKSISQINNLRSKKTLNDLVKQVDYCLNESKKRGFLNQKDYRETIASYLYMPYGFLSFVKMTGIDRKQKKENKLFLMKKKQEFFYLVFHKYKFDTINVQSSWWKKIIYLFRFKIFDWRKVKYIVKNKLNKEKI